MLQPDLTKQPGDPVGIVVDPETLRRFVEALRPTSRPRRCFWCARPIDGGVCHICDAEGGL